MGLCENLLIPVNLKFQSQSHLLFGNTSVLSCFEPRCQTKIRTWHPEWLCCAINIVTVLQIHSGSRQDLAKVEKTLLIPGGHGSDVRYVVLLLRNQASESLNQPLNISWVFDPDIAVHVTLVLFAPVDDLGAPEGQCWRQWGLRDRSLFDLYSLVHRI